MGEHNILPELVDLAVDVAELTNHPGNYRRGNIDVIAESLRVNGQYRPLVVQKSTGHIVAGNHTYRAALRLGWPVVAATLLDLEEEDALRILAVDNASSDQAENDEAELAQLLSRIAEEQGSLQGTGWTDEGLADLLDKMSEKLDVEEGDAPVDVHEVVWGVVITCRDEDQQLELLRRLDDEGLAVRALM
ncbi:ParB N-terminal domain-containing protein [Nonomuraea sp. NPDC050556]|uniref:ParB N-terminal domain-containing protein n=1 Tax=Nonomuraea sp. NPDC050556 TaxID=3364369 RepID=UPI003789AA2A